MTEQAEQAEQTQQEIVLDNLSKIAVWAKDVVIIPTPNPKAMLSWVIRYSAAVGVGVFYAWEVNPVSYIGANLLDLPTSTQLPIVLGLAQILYDVRDHPYSVAKVIDIFNELGISNSMLCETQATYLSYTDVLAEVIKLLGVTC